MPKIKYKKINLNTHSRYLLDKCQDIIINYQSKGFTLTLRQLYYQLVSKNLILNEVKAYKALVVLISKARLGGFIDWNAIEDRTRFIRTLPHWHSPLEIITATAGQYRRDKWEWQKYRPEIWIEKDALIGVIEPICNKYDVPYFSCRGYSSLSEMWRAGLRSLDAMANTSYPKYPIIIHLGDHDPSGLDMTRDIQNRMNLFTGRKVKVVRIALNMNQIRKAKPLIPPNPTKITDSRAPEYIKKFSNDSWELDALPPDTLMALVETEVKKYQDMDNWRSTERKERKERALLANIVDKWDRVKKAVQPK